MKLTEGTGPDGRVAEIGQIVIDWVCKHIRVSTLLAYVKAPNFSLSKFSNSDVCLSPFNELPRNENSLSFILFVCSTFQKVC